MKSFEKAKDIIKKLEDNGFEAYIVGGAVRDRLLDIAENDIDIASSATPKQICEIFDSVVETGLLYGTITVIYEDEEFEITRFRTEGDYEDCRHPLYVLPAGSIEEDLSRRDFTINAMAYGKDNTVIDPFDGKKDLKEKIIRCVGDPYIRFNEDPLRILRAYRFSSLMDFSIEEETAKASIKRANLLGRVSTERVAIEIIRLLIGIKPSVINPILQTGYLKEFGINATDISICDRCRENILIRFKALAYAGNTLGKDLAKSLHLCNKFINEISVIDDIVSAESIDKIALKKYLKDSSPDLVKTGLWARKDILGDDISDAKIRLKEITENNEPCKISDLKISGNDLKELGYNGKEIGDKLNFLLDEVLKNPALNEKDTLISLIKK